ncbi:MAG TPA: glycerophosphodiester phosphodiesterase family protein [Isosphaeraceae bacterium]|nr:glycerophosphodiester phosphodiesterase family protein [Isosphaeraceae bacterium]
MSYEGPIAMPSAAASARVNRFRSLFRTLQGRPLILAHRGDSFHAPENTLEAARAGWESGADAWELDVQLTRDGVPIVLHDESLSRTTDAAARFANDPRGAAGWLVSDFDFEEIRPLDAGSWFLDPSGGPRTAARFGTLDSLGSEARARYRSGMVRVPTLRDALQWTVRCDWLVNVEVKSFPNTDPRLVEAVLAVIDATGAADRVLISSFDHAEVARVAARRPEIATGVLAATPLHRPEFYARALVRADAYHPSTLVLGAGADRYRRAPSSRSLRADDLAALGRAGVPTLVYTVNDTLPGGLAAHLVEAGAFGLFTDDPRAMVGLFRAGGARSDREGR